MNAVNLAVTCAGCAIAPMLALIGSPTAAADINISGINIGNQHNAQATFGNVAIATRGGVASATGGIGNIAVADNGAAATTEGGVLNVVAATGPAEVSKTGPGSLNFAAGIGHSAQIVINGNSNGNIVGAGPGGVARINNSNGNIAFAGRDSTARVTNANLNVQTAFCGGSSVSGQSVRIGVSAPCIGIGG